MHASSIVHDGSSGAPGSCQLRPGPTLPVSNSVSDRGAPPGQEHVVRALSNALRDQRYAGFMNEGEERVWLRPE